MNKFIGTMLTIVALLLSVNIYLTYRSALVLEEVTNAELAEYPMDVQMACARSTTYCPKRWHLKG